MPLRGRSGPDWFLEGGATEAQATALAEHREPLTKDAGFAWRVEDGLVLVTQRGRDYVVTQDGTIKKATC